MHIGMELLVMKELRINQVSSEVDGAQKVHLALLVLLDADSR
jgi:hypothetical protein